MNFEEWEPVYTAICNDFGYSREADERARDVLAETVGTNCYDPAELAVDGETIAIAGAAGRLEEDVALARQADSVFAASTAADRLIDCGVTVDCMVTDLDKNPETARELTIEGTPVAAHAHGDNIDAVKEHVPTFRNQSLIPTTQAAPVGRVRNFGGFTDGDRAAFLADHLGAARLVFPGWTIDDPDVGPEKHRKLQWAQRLLYWLERRRDEQFTVLDGQRDTIESLQS